MPEITILWGEAPQPEDKPKRYTFDTEAEKRAFLQGVDETVGWMGYEIVEGEGG